MTPELYALYTAAYADASPFHGGGNARRAAAFDRRRGHLTSLELAVVGLAVHDATNGTPPRSPGVFGRTLREGWPALGPLVEPSGARLQAG